MELQAGGKQSSSADVHADLCDRLPEGVSVERDGSRPSVSCRHVTRVIRLLSSCVCPSHHVSQCRQHEEAVMRWSGLRMQAQS